MKETTKRILSLVLAFVMVLGLLPGLSVNVSAAEGVIDAAIFCSDVHGNPSTVTSVFNGIKSADSTFAPSTASFVGDTQTTASSVTSAAQEVYSSVQCIYAFGNHDDEGNYGIEDFTGLSYGSSSTNYYIYTISENDMSTSSPDTSGFTSTVAGLDKTKPLFIISHMPLHQRRNDNNGAAAWYEAISAAAESMDIFFFWAHNHTSEGDADIAAYYVAKNGSETISIQGGSTVTPNFTYANAGYIDPTNVPARNNVATAVRIYDDSVNLTVYNASGELSGTYAVNETVTRQFASTDSGDGGSTTPTTDPGEGEEENTTVTYNYTATAATDGTGYILVSNGYALQNNDGAMSAVAVTVSDDGSTITFADTVDVSTLLWTIDSDGKMMNGDYYFLRTSGSGSYITYISTECASDSKFYSWTYADDTLTCASTSSTYYAYYNTAEGAFWTSQGTSQELKFYVPSGTVSGGGSTEGGTDEDDTTTGGSTETVVGNGTYTTADDGSYQKVTFGSTTTEKKTVYMLTSSITSGTAYLIANSNSAGSAYVVANNSGEVDATGVTVVEDDTIGTYIELTDATDELWTTSGSSSTSLKNGSYYLNYSGSKGNYSLNLSTSSASWTYSSNRLSIVPNRTTYYVVYDSGWDMSSSSDNVYFYVPTEVDTTVDTTKTHEVTASDIEHFYSADTTDTETVAITASVTDGTPDGTYAYEVVGGDNIITSISEDGDITFNGTEGTAQVKVSYTWIEGENTYTIWQVIDVTATSPYYTIDLHKANSTVKEVTGLTAFEEGKAYYILNEDGTYTLVDTTTTPDAAVTYYQVTYTVGDEITAPIAIKGIEEGDRYGVWAVVKYYDGTTADGTDMGAVGNAIEWSSSDPSVATVDPVTGIITFTGKEGTVQITATYLNGNNPSDTITISVTPSQYTIPSDGTTDFPEYPNEGAIRYDKTATAVGNFSETGIAQLELSMTGVPYTTGSEIDVVLMLDMTGSMTTDSMAAAEAAAKAFADQIVKNEDGTYNKNRISVQVFTIEGVTELWSLSAVTADTYSSLVTAIESASDNRVGGGTPYSTALQECYEILYAAKSDGIGNNRSQYCVFVSDGTPTSVTYITNTTTPTTTTTVSFTRNDATYTQTVPAYSTGSTASTFYGSTSYHEYWSQLMINNGVTVFGVYTSAAAGSSGSQGSGGSGSGSVNDTAEGTNAMTNVASSADNVYVVEDYTDTSAVEGALTSVAQKIMQAATDVTVEDKISDYYTMIFDIPTGTQDITGVTNDFYIEFVKYTLDSTTHERVDSDSDGDTYDDATSVAKLYVKNTDGVLSAAKDSTGTDYDAPVFEQKLIGDKGTLYYWTTDSSYADKAAVSYSDGTNTYYFIPYGMEQNEDGTAPDGWYNMTSGAYAYGTIENYGTLESTNMSTNLVIATPYFVYNAESKMIYWTVDKLENATTEYALRYFLYLDNSATEVGEDAEVDPGSYLTNDYAYITYTNFQGNDCRQEFPKPQLTWSGAQVSYIFYLVNAAGQPINKSGQVVDFANATFVTDLYTENTVWNKGEDGQITADSQLSIDWLAANLLPSDYKVYDEAAQYQLHVYGDHTGESIFDYFTIGGSDAETISSSLNARLTNVNTTASTVSLTTTKVYNTKAGQKITGYGIYTSEATDTYDNETVLSNFDFYNTTVAFAVVWQPSLAPDTIVVDYGLDVLINVTFNDLMQDNTISGIGLGRDAYGNIVENTGISTTKVLGAAALTTSDGSTISIEPVAEGKPTQIRFSQNDMTFDAPVTFYYESEVEYYENSEMKTGYLHTSVTVIPATTIYYEDEYVTLKTYELDSADTDGDSDTAEYIETAGWDYNSVKASATQAQDRPGTTSITGVLDADNNYGYDSAYETMSQFSMGSAAMVTVKSGTYATAEFTFYGTGFDIISMTDTTTGTILIDVYKGTDTTAKPVVSEEVDTYYGYKRVDNEDGTYDWETTTPGDPNALYQVPVMKIGDGTTTEVLPYGQYTAVITVSYIPFLDPNAAKEGYDFYLDAIRIYNPTGNQNQTAVDAYIKDGEAYPEYFEVRDQIIGKETFDALEDEAISGIVFIDGAIANPTIEDYKNYGPNNELYLAKDQAVAFELNAAANAGEVAKIQLAVKTVGGTGDVEVYSVGTDGTKTAGLSETIETATDMYYDITELNSKTVVIRNAGTDEDAIISITNVKVTYTEPQTSEAAAISEETAETAEAPAMFSIRRSTASAAVLSLTEDEQIPEETEPETTVPEETEPETTAPEETEPETTVPEETEPEATEPDDEPSGGGITDPIIELIRKLLGWIFG